MNVEEIMIRLGVDARAVTTGLGRVTSFVRGWGVSLVNDLKGTFGRLLTVYGLERAAEGIKDKILAIKRAQDELGVSSNFVQGVFNKAGAAGLNYEALSKPLIGLKATIDSAKAGSVDAQEKFIKWGLATKDTNFKALEFDKTLAKLSDQYLKLGKNVAMIKDLGVKPSPAILNLLEGGGKGIEDFNKGNFFTKMTPGTIENFAAMYSAGKKLFVGAGAFVANVANYALAGLRATAVGISQGILGTAHLFGAMKDRNIENPLKYVLTGDTKYINSKKLTDEQEKRADYAAAELAAEKEGYTIEEKRLELTEQQTKLKQEQARTQNQINDRDKGTVEEMADRARQLLGLSKMPRGLQSVYTVTPQLRAALKIQTLEDQAKVQAQAYGNLDAAAGLQGEADQLRLQNPGLKSTEQDPTLQMRNSLADIALALEKNGIIIKQLPNHTP